MRKLFVLAVAALSAFAAQAQADYPTAPIRIINISSPGAGGDAIARMLADKMTPIVKGTFIMDNRPGAGGAIAADAGAKAKPDGYTLLFGGFTSHVLLAAVRPNLSYDPAKDFDPVGQIGTASIQIGVPGTNTSGRTINRAPSAAAEPISCSTFLVVASRSINT